MSELRGGIDLGGTKIQTAIVDAGGAVKGEARQPTPTKGGPADVARAMEDALREAASDAGVSPAELRGVGVGSPGDADGRTGVVSGARNLPGWEGSFPLGETLSKALGTEVRVGNDVQVAVEGEHRLGAGRTASAQNLLDVEAIVIGGGLGVRFGDRFMKDLEGEMHKHLFVADGPPKMHVAELGDLGGAIGASLLVG